MTISSIHSTARSITERTLATLPARIGADKRGSTGIIFALMLAPAVMLLGVSIDYSRAASVRTAMQQSADTAALGTVQAAAAGNTSSSNLTLLAKTIFASNLPKSVMQGAPSCSPTVSVQTANDVSTASVKCSVCVPTSFASIMGSKCTSVAAATTAQSYVQSIITRGFVGVGNTWGDPHINGADGTASEIDGCDTGKWFDLLSDSGLEINITCQPWGGVSIPVVTSFSVVIGTHVASLTFPNSAIAQAGWNTWYSYDPVFAVDGVPVTSIPSTPQSYLNGQVTFGRQYLADDYQGINVTMPVMTVNAGNYAIVIAFPYGGYIQMTANGVGRCGTPGGIWGGTLAGIDDFKAGDFQVSGPSATEAAFTKTNCTTAQLGPRIIR